jgi:hypothetical protein
MLLIEGLRKKREITKPDGTRIIDLTEASYEFRGEMLITGTIVVTEDFEMRPDLVAKQVYGDSNKLDYILKFNGISNPFSLQTGDVLLLVAESDMKNSQTKQNETQGSKEDIRKRFFDPKRLNKKDQKRLEYIKKKAQSSSGNGNASQTNLPPNFAEPGSKEITVKDGKVIFGADVVGNKDNCPVPASRARVKAKLLENKIFKNNTK